MQLREPAVRVARRDRSDAPPLFTLHRARLRIPGSSWLPPSRSRHFSLALFLIFLTSFLFEAAIERSLRSPAGRGGATFRVVTLVR